MGKHTLRHLGDDHLRAIRMKIEGCKAQEIADELGVTIRRVYLWFGSPVVKAELARQQERIFDVFAERMATAAFGGMKALEEMSGMPLTEEQLSPSVKLEVIRELLDRHPATVKVRDSGSGVGEPAGGIGTQNNFLVPPPPGMTDAQLFDRLRSVAAELPPGVIDGHAQPATSSPSD